LLADVVADFLDSVTEREFDAPFLALLRAHGYSKIHLLHGQFEFGKDAIAQRGEPPTQYGFQTKVGDINLPQWSSQVRGQVEITRTNDLAHPDYNTALPRKAVLVLTGRLVGGAPLEIQNYKQHIEAGGGFGFDVWDRERLIELMAASPDVGLTGFSDGPILELLGRTDQGKVTESSIERFSERWIGGTDGIAWSALLEAAIIANRLRLAQRLDLACFTALCLLRAMWASAHRAEPPPERTIEQRDTAVAMFLNYSHDLWSTHSEELLDPKEIIRDDIGVIVTYPVQCVRLIEILGLYGLCVSDEAEGVANWLAQFIIAQPGAAHPISDRWAVSLIPAILLVSQFDSQVSRSYLTEVLRWMGDRHDNDGLGMAGPHAEAREEVEYLLGSSLESVERPPRRQSYLAAVVLDLAALLEDEELYDLAYNEVAALDIRPFLALPRDDVSQYMATGHGIDVPLNTSPHYAESFAEGTDWRMAEHHDDDLTRYYLGRLGRLWDHLSISVVTRDRHWVACLRGFLNPADTEPELEVTAN
jgi:hypothetical protein